jgi:hypothetical protein
MPLKRTKTSRKSLGKRYRKRSTRKMRGGTQETKETIERKIGRPVKKFSFDGNPYYIDETNRYVYDYKSGKFVGIYNKTYELLYTIKDGDVYDNADGVKIGVVKPNGYVQWDFIDHFQYGDVN